MILAITSRALGSKKNLICHRDDNSFYWSDTIPDGSWVYSDPSFEKDLGVLIDASGIDISGIFEEEEIKAWKCLRGDGINGVPSHYVLRGESFKNRLSNLLDQLWLFLGDDSNCYYREEFLIGRRLLMSLQRPKINKDIFCNPADFPETFYL